MKFGVGMRDFEGWPELALPATGKEKTGLLRPVFFYVLSCKLLGNVPAIV